MSIAENPDKVKNIVRNGGSPVRFRDLYTRFMRTSSASELRGFTTEHMCDGDIDDVGDNKLLAPEYIELHQNVSAKARANLLLSLPLVFRRRMVGHVEDASIEEASVQTNPAVDSHIGKITRTHPVHPSSKSSRMFVP